MQILIETFHMPKDFFSSQVKLSYFKLVLKSLQIKAFPGAETFLKLYKIKRVNNEPRNIKKIADF